MQDFQKCTLIISITVVNWGNHSQGHVLIKCHGNKTWQCVFVCFVLALFLIEEILRRQPFLFLRSNQLRFHQMSKEIKITRTTVLFQKRRQRKISNELELLLQRSINRNYFFPRLCDCFHWWPLALLYWWPQLYQGFQNYQAGFLFPRY